MKYTKERHIVFQEVDVIKILADYLKNKGENVVQADEIELSFDKYKHGNEITLMFDDITEPDMWTAELKEFEEDKNKEKTK